MQLFMKQVSTFAGDIDGLVVLITLIVGFWFILAEAVFFGLLFRFRKQPGGKAQYITGELHHEKKWIDIPHWLIIACDVVLIVGAIKVWMVVKMDMPETDLTVRVVAQQWAWTFTNPGPDGQLDTADDIRTTDELHVPVGKKVKFELTAQDVLHSFSVPVFRLKQDAIPGRVITGWFEATRVGSYDIQCTEICGIGHGIMPAKIIVEDERTHALWLQDPVATIAVSTFPPSGAPQ